MVCVPPPRLVSVYNLQSPELGIRAKNTGKPSPFPSPGHGRFPLCVLTNPSPAASCQIVKSLHCLMIFVHLSFLVVYYPGFPGGSDSKESTCNAGDLGFILGCGRSPGEGNGNPLQYSCLGNPMDREAWQTTVQGCKGLDVTERLTLIISISPTPNRISGLLNIEQSRMKTYESY